MQKALSISNASAGADTPASSGAEARRQYHIKDWLDLHGLTARQCEAVMSRAVYAGGGDPHISGCPAGLSCESAWNVAATAMLAAFPQASTMIDHVRINTLRMFRADTARAPRPFTLGAGPDGRPIVVLRYRGRIGDLITVAHEFGHAVQIAASTNTFVPPVNREICAFVSELALLRHLGSNLPVKHGPAMAAWETRNADYLGRYAAQLALALKDPAAVYRYTWNYPIARVLASECFAQLPGDPLWAIFENRLPLAGIATFLGCAHRGSPTCHGACMTKAPPPFHEPVTLHQ